MDVEVRRGLRPWSVCTEEMEMTESRVYYLGCDDSARGGEDVCEGRAITG